MYSTPEQALLTFMDRHWDKQSRLLLAFSGGPDSLALLHLLLAYFHKRKLAPQVCLALAHVDHGWRAESRQESQQLSCLAAELGLIFHHKTLAPSPAEGNLEEVCREARLHFFADLCRQSAYQAVLFGQHADDQAETVLKRIFEGAALYHLSGIRPVTAMQGMTLWRPLLQVTKQQLGAWLSARQLRGIDDYTNRDQRFLRAKLRTQILPELSRLFGKEVSGNLAKLGADTAELHTYLAAKMAPHLAQAQRGPFGTWFNFNAQASLLPLETKYLVRACCEMEKVFLARANLQCAVELLGTNAANKRLSAGDHFIHLDRGNLFVDANPFAPLPPHKLQLDPGSYFFGGWSVRVTVVESVEVPQETLQEIPSWRDMWRGRAAIVLPMAPYQLAAPQSCAALVKWWTNAKVPAFLRWRMPAIYRGDALAHEFLSGRRTIAHATGVSLKIELSA